MSKSRLLPTFCAIAVGLGTAVTGAPSASAAPLYVPLAAAPTTDVMPVNHDIMGMNESEGYVYLRGHRGSRHQRPGYRYHDGWWFPPAAFALGAIIGGAIATQPRYHYREYYGRPIYRAPAYRPSYGSAHVEWCYNRYRSYRAWDNTFQPYRGPRRQCVSPYS